MLRQEREELERQVQALERDDPDRSAAEVDRELAQRLPVAYGNWASETPTARSRFRAIQRWRRGARGRDAGKSAVHLFPYVWPLGERQRKEVDPSFTPSRVTSSGSWRLFLYNCGPEVVRDVRIFLDGAPIDYAPSILTGHFAEIHWGKVEALRTTALLSDRPDVTPHELRVEFVIAKGTRQSKLVGALDLDPAQGWVHFGGRDGRAREVE